MSNLQASASAPLNRRQTLLTFSGLLLVMLLASLDQTIVSTALPTIVAELGSLEQLSWVVTAYLLAATVSTPLWGRISDLYGRKPLLMGAIGIFLAGSALSGAAQTLGELIAFRALQGLGAGGLMTLAMAIVADIISPRERGRYQGYIQMVFVLASVAGPLLGGVFTDHLSWRWVFYVNLPIGALALGIIAPALRLPTHPGRPKIDYPGAALLAGGLTSLLLLATWGGREYAWGSAEVVGLGIAAIALLGAFVAQERRAPEPILPLRLFRDPVFDVVATVLFLTTCAFFAAIVFMPIFLQVVTGASATSSGLLLLPLLLATTTSTALVGRVIARTGRYKVFPATGLGLMAVGLFLLSRMDASTSRATASAFMVVFGAGFGMVSQILVLAIQNAVDRRDIGIATASANLCRALGGSVGVALFGSVFAGRLDVWLPREVPASPDRLDPQSLQASPEALHSLPPAVQHGVAEAVAHSLQTVFLVAAPIAALGLLVVLFLREVPLRGPGVQGENEKKGDRNDIRREQAGDPAGTRGALREGQFRSRRRADPSGVRQPRGAAGQPSGPRRAKGDDQLAARALGPDAQLQARGPAQTASAYSTDASSATASRSAARWSGARATTIAVSQIAPKSR
jgi:EmrB/QacA subfamily drug resistance transporter